MKRVLIEILFWTAVLVVMIFLMAAVIFSSDHQMMVLLSVVFAIVALANVFQMKMPDFDWRRFTGLQVTAIASFVFSPVLIAVGFSGAAHGIYWIALVCNTVVAFFGAFFVAYPRKDGTWRRIGEKSK